jgi:hypothetical protein
MRQQAAVAPGPLLAPTETVPVGAMTGSTLPSSLSLFEVASISHAAHAAGHTAVMSLPALAYCAPFLATDRQSVRGHRLAESDSTQLTLGVEAMGVRRARG